MARGACKYKLIMNKIDTILDIQDKEKEHGVDTHGFRYIFLVRCSDEYKTLEELDVLPEGTIHTVEPFY